jgi:aminoglycoside/choline kinase family phosphotransferase/choline kinase
MMSSTCFIPGAGLGTRLRPLTGRLPKPLLPVGGRPLISYAMDHCLTVGIKRFIVNTHHLAAAYEGAFPGGLWRKTPIIFRYEPILLDTAGGLKNIEDLLCDDEPLLVYNGDILSDLPLLRLLAAHKKEGREATLVLRSNGSNRNVSLDRQGQICDIRGILGNHGVKKCLFTGIYIVEKCFLRRLTTGKVESVVLPLVEMIRQEPGSVASIVIDEGIWEDIGDTEAYDRVSRLVPAPAYEQAQLDVHKRQSENGKVDFAEGNPAGNPTEYEGCEDNHSEEEFVRVTLGISAKNPVEFITTGKGGSDRSYFRVVVLEQPSAILMRYGDMYEENDVYVFVASFLREIGVRVPAIYNHDPVRRLILMEDIGDVDLYALRERPWGERRALYEKTLEIAVKMHSFSPEGLTDIDPRASDSPRLMAGYDEKLYRWERNYFREHLVRNVCGLKAGAPEGDNLEAELAGLAAQLLKTKNSLIHRDLQSQNVMVKEETPVLIDFQGMRFGSLFYDLGSLLYDPYVRFPAGARDYLLRFYYDLEESPYSWETFRALFFQASAQRLMQALGAYGFLGLKRGKPHFLFHIPGALENLVEASQAAGVLPELNALARRCRDALAEPSL